MSIKSLPREARPREKLLARGAGALSDAELLALLLRTGMAGKGVLQLAEELLQLPRQGAIHGGSPLGGIAGLLSATPRELSSVRGLGPAKRAEIMAVLELARRALSQQLCEQPVLSAPDTMKQYLQSHLAHLRHEVFAVCFLNVQNRMLAMEQMFQGTLSQTSVHPREVARRALHHSAAAVVLAHNHPSGSVQPSMADHSVTSALTACLAMLEVRVLDHIIVAPGAALSMAEQGML